MTPETPVQVPGLRFYSPGLGRWTSRDPIGEAGGANTHLYVWNTPASAVDALGLDPNTATSEITPWELGWEWLTGDGPSHRDFGPGDYMTEELRKHGHVKDSAAQMAAEVAARCRSCAIGSFGRGYPYKLSGWGGVLKYLHDYSTLGTGGIAGNLAVTYLGSYTLEITASDTSCCRGTATLSFVVENTSSVASATRPPVLGYTRWWLTYIDPYVNWATQTIGHTTTQTFRWTETVTFGPNPACGD